jgi:hypothetical protein
MEIYIIIRGYNQYPKASKIPADNWQSTALDEDKNKV